ncbi:MAG: flippase [Bacteroidota bacterium]
MSIKRFFQKIPDSAYAMMGQGANMLGALLVMLMLVRAFDAALFGIWVLYQALFTFAEMARMGFVQNGLVKFATGHPTHYKEILTSAFALNMALGIGLWGLLIVVTPLLANLWETPALTHLVWHYGFTVVTLGSLRFMEYIQMANKDFRGVFWGNLIAGLSYACLIGLAFWGAFELQPVHAIYGQGIGACVGLVFVWFYRRSFFRFGSFKLHWLKKLFHYCKYVLGTNISSMILQKVDIAMLAYFINPAAVALYNISSKAPNYMEVPLKGGAQFYFPRIAEAAQHKTPRDVARLFEGAIGMLLAINIPLFLGAFVMAKYIMLFMGGKEYIEGYFILQILLFNTLIKPWGRMFGTTMDAIGYPKVNFRMVFFSLFANALLNYLLIPIWGVLGAALATTCTLCLSTLVSLVILRKYVPISPWRSLAQILVFYRRLTLKLIPKLT